MVQAIGTDFEFMLLPHAVECHGELGTRHRSVTPEAPRQADVVVAAFDMCIGIAEVAGDAGADTDRPPRSDEAWCLLDMQFQVCTQPRRIEEAAAGTQHVGVAAAVGDVFGEGTPRVDPAHVQSTIRQRAKRSAAADIRYLEPDALLGADPHHRKVARQRDAEAL